MTRAIQMPEGIEVELSDLQATWIGLEPAADPNCDGCVLFGLCALHDYPNREEIEP
ncbi:MAG: hypothetical protein RIS45_1234 [Planctomycetota bacterium]|jgi:hypothetical protein